MAEERETSVITTGTGDVVSMRVDRMLGIVTLLLQKGMLTASQLAEHFAVSTRTIYRDVEAISLAGVPIYASKGSRGGIALAEGYTLQRLPVSDSERESLLLALQTLGVTRYPGVDTMLCKLSALFSGLGVDWVSVEFSHWGSTRDESQRFSTIRESILGQRVLVFDYWDAAGQSTCRQVEPAHLAFVGYTWYLHAWCRNRLAWRTFKVTRMRDVHLTGEHFLRRSQDQLRAHMQQSRQDSAGTPMLNCKLLFHPRTEYRVYDMFDQQLIQRLPDGGLLVTVSWPEDEWLYGTLLSFGGSLQVLEPRHLREIIRGRLAEALHAYEV